MTTDTILTQVNDKTRQSDILVTSQTNHLCRARLTLSGTVQGVGFRPYVYGLAKSHRLVGFVRNLGGKLQIEIQGSPDIVDNFIAELFAKAPPLASIKQFEKQVLVHTNNQSDFSILPSLTDNDDWQAVPPDSATCSDCLFELFHKNDRRFQYPFINCVNCGPRFTVITDLPYDREYTSMSRFKMCDQCRREYEDPSSRRFHAQPNGCPICGPILRLLSSEKGRCIDIGDQHTAVLDTLTRLQKGDIVAIKGLGGFQLACDATNTLAVHNLRIRKKRPTKPFAVMMQDLSMVQKYCLASAEEQELLSSSKAPIVLLRALRNSAIATNIAPGNYRLGVMLPYTPLHHMLAAAFAKPLLMTSGNISEEPIVIDNQEALHELEAVADCFLLNDREISARYDDSVTRVDLTKSIVLRRARGYAPEPIELGCKSMKTILSFGAQLKNTFCFVKGEQAFISPHIGDLDNIKTSDHFDSTLNKYEQLFKLKAELLACDLHPDYISSRLAESFAEREKLSLIRVQHHHAHIVSCMVEHKLSGPVIGVALDGAGYGLDDTVWGGEFLITKIDHFRRFACLEPVTLPGSEQAIRNPWRMALAYIFKNATINQDPFKEYLEELKLHIGSQSIDLVRQQIKRGFNAPLTSSCGRLFDAVSSILGLCHQASFEGEAAMHLESTAMEEENERHPETEAYPYTVITNMNSQSYHQSNYSDSPLMNNLKSNVFRANYHVSTDQMLSEIALDKNAGVRLSAIAMKFHHTLAAMITDLCCRIRNDESISTVCLSGGVWQNYLLCRCTVKLLQSKGFSVFFPQQVPANDGGISLGQAVIASAQTGNLTL